MNRLLVFAFLFFTVILSAQEKTNTNWQLKDPKKDHVYGAGVERAYELLKGRTAKPVIVAVIDGGTDVNHDDLKANIWTNTKEIPGNGLDDDHNGYVDDIHGWNFLGGKNGEIDHETTEMARQYHKLHAKFGKMDSTQVAASDLPQYRQYLKIKTAFSAEQMQTGGDLMVMKELDKLITNIKNKNQGTFTRQGVKDYKPTNEIETQLRKALKLSLLFAGKPEELEKEVKEGLKQAEHTLQYSRLNTDSIRRLVVGDDPDNSNEHFYGNNNVIGPEALHGTHVAGLIGAVRNNNLGIDGVANNVQIMVLRAVPDGDERDKDIANAIHYAVDNGATVINMSFGKYYVSDKAVLDEAIQYAADHDVLLVHAAGNESKDIDQAMGYPSRKLNSGKWATNWIEVGASSARKGKFWKASHIVGVFSNYGKTQVDLFAPGVDVYSTLPNNAYGNESGTSMASPVTAGVAALIRSYFPELKASQVREILNQSVVPFNKKVFVPGTKKKKAKMKDLCISGGFVNAGNAVELLLKKEGKVKK